MNKYNARKVIVDGIKFDSRREAARYQELKLLERAGQIRNLELQPQYTLMEGFRHEGKAISSITYKADFKYFDNNLNIEVVEDSKGFKTDVYKIKKKLLLKKYPNINFREV